MTLVFKWKNFELES